MFLLRIFWDLDGTLLNTVRLFDDVLDDLAATVGKPREAIDREFVHCNCVTFTWELLFDRVGLTDDQLCFDKRNAYLSYLGGVMQDFLYPGMIEVVVEFADVAEHVLVTAGDPPWQRTKWGMLGPLTSYFKPPDLHFIPLAGSKGMRIASYRDNPVKILVDDTVARLREAKLRNPTLIGILMVWEGEDPPREDGDDWLVAHNADELRAILRRIVNELKAEQEGTDDRT